MNSIKKIQFVKSFGFMSNFTWSSGLSDFSKFNLLYGFTGSGKTTLSCLLAVLENQKLRTDDGYQHAEFNIKINGKPNKVTHTSLHNAPHIRVFNKDYIERQIDMRGTSAESFFYLTKLNPKEKKRLDQLNIKKEGLSEKLMKATNKRNAIKKSKDELLTNTGRIVRAALATLPEYINYDARNADEQLKPLLAGKKQPKKLNKSVVQSKTEQAAGAGKKEPVTESTPLVISNLATIVDRVANILKQKVKSKLIKELREDQKLHSWVKTGRHLHTNQPGELCKYCGNKLSKERTEDLAEHFNKHYEDFIKKVDALISQVRSELEVNHSNPDPKLFFSDMQTEVNKLCNNVESALNNWNKGVQTTLTILKEKIDLPSSTPQYSVNLKTAYSRLRDSINKLIVAQKIHNQRVKKFYNERLTVAKEIELHYSSVILKDMKKLGLDMNKAQVVLDDSKAKLETLAVELKRLEEKSAGDEAAVKELNKVVTTILGRSDIVLETSNEGFKIKRNGNPATTLSDGEQTALAFAYFYAKLKERGFSTKNCIVVIDDPVSSLDHHRLYGVSSYIKEISKSCEQLFLLTHNFEFFREMKRWLKNKNKPGTPNVSELYMVEACFDESVKKRVMQLTPLHKLLEKYESDYHYNFCKLYQFANSSPPNVDDAYFMPNIARKFLETFLAFKAPSRKGLDGMGKICKDKAKASTIQRFLGFHNHADYIDKVTQLDHIVLGGAQDTVKLILEIVESEHGDPNHIQELKKLFKPNTQRPRT